MKKMYIKSDFKAIFFKPATNGQSDKGFLLTSKVCPQGIVEVAERLALPTSDHGVVGSNPARGEILLEP